LNFISHSSEKLICILPAQLEVINIHGVHILVYACYDVKCELQSGDKVDRRFKMKKSGALFYLHRGR
jgi:hypothetical protein